MLPMSELPRDNFSAYKRTILQEHLYQSLFKDDEENSNERVNEDLMANPLLLLENKDITTLNMKEFDLRLTDLIKEVQWL